MVWGEPTGRIYVPLWLFLACCSDSLAQPTHSVTNLSAPVPAHASSFVQPQNTLSLDEVVALGLQRNPSLAQASWQIDQARGLAWQAGLYPNPTVSATFDELGDRTGAGGINTVPLVSQEVVTAGKLRLSRAVAQRAVDQATLMLLVRRYDLLAGVRQRYFEVLTLQRRIEILDELVKLAEQSVATTKQLLQAKQVARLDLVQLEVDLERFRANKEAAEQELPGAFRRLAATVGVYDLPLARLQGSVDDPLPDYDFQAAQAFVARQHPAIQLAHAGVERAQLLLRRAQVEPIPNITVGSGYVRQNQNGSDDWVIGASIPIPVWNRNQGNIRAAEAAVAVALQEINRVQNDLVDRLAQAFRNYMSSRRRAERFRQAILPKAQETYELALKAYKGGQFAYLRVLEAQRSLAQAKLEYVQALGDAWMAASTISGLLLEEQWPWQEAAPKQK
ncbi:MAG: divalent cation transporter [Gemmatales bacterium]|nr:MAG: divalent cation transporter [Gemmatales bacterium]